MFITKICPLLEYASPISGGLPKYLADDLQWIQNHLMDILGLSRDVLEHLDVRRDKHTVQAFNTILMADDHPCQRFINEIMHSYSLQAQQVAGLEITPVRSSATRRFFPRASNFLSLLAPQARAQARRSLTKFLITILRTKGKS